MTYVCVELTDWYVLILRHLRSASVCLYYWSTNTFREALAGTRMAEICRRICLDNRSAPGVL